MVDKLVVNNLKLKVLKNFFCHWFFINILFGYHLARTFYNFWEIANKLNIYNIRELKKKLKSKYILKFLLIFCLEFIIHWVLNLVHKFINLCSSIWFTVLLVWYQSQSICNFNYNFVQLKMLLSALEELLLVGLSLWKEGMFFIKIQEWFISRRNIIQLVFKTKIGYELCFILSILLAILGILLGFLLGLYKCKKNRRDIYLLYILFLLKIIYDESFDYVLAETNEVKEFSKICLRPMEQVEIGSSRLILENPNKIPSPFLIIEDQFIVIETELLFQEHIDYKFEFFNFYKDINQKLKH